MIIIIYLRGEVKRYHVRKKNIIMMHIYKLTWGYTLPLLYSWLAAVIDMWIACGDSNYCKPVVCCIMLLVAMPPVCMPHWARLFRCCLSRTETWSLCTRWEGLASIEKTIVTIIQTFDYVLLWLQLVHIPCWDTGWLVMYLNTISLSAISIHNIGMTVYTMLKHITHSHMILRYTSIITMSWVYFKYLWWVKRLACQLYTYSKL